MSLYEGLCHAMVTVAGRRIEVDSIRQDVGVCAESVHFEGIDLCSGKQEEHH